MSEFDKQESELLRLLRQSSFDDRPSEQHREALRRRVLQAFDHAARQQSHVPVRRNQPPVNSVSALNKWRGMMRRPVPRLIAAAIICLSITAPWLFFPAHQTKAHAFEKLASAIVEAKTAKFQLELKAEGPNGGPAGKIKAPIISQCYYRAPGISRVEISLPEMKTIAIHDDETGRSIQLEPAKKTAMLTTTKGKPSGQGASDPFTQVKELLKKRADKSGAENEFKDLGERQIDGRRVVGFRAKAGFGETTIWGDPATQLPVRIETVTYGPTQMTVVMSKFEVNVDLDESLFDMTAPAGYQTQTVEIDASDPSEQDFIDALKKCVALGGGEYPPGISYVESSAFIVKQVMEKSKGGKKDGEKTPDLEVGKKLQEEIVPILRGLRFVLKLPEAADASYAGKGVKQEAKDKPIFWYKPKDSKTYRVIYADQTVKDAETAPTDPNAVRVIPKTETPRP